jgi:beta-lactam-binding protein with PASTA domain
MSTIKRNITIFFTILCIALIAFIVFEKFTSTTYTMSDFTGQTEEDVRNWADANNVPSSSLIFNTAYDDTAASGTIIDQSLEAGETFKEDDVITFTVSLGPDPSSLVTLPDFAGQTQEEIQAWCDENGFTNVTFSTQDSDQTEGTCIGMDPAAGTSMSPSAALTITLSHQTYVTFPDFTGQTLDTIDAWCTSNSITPYYIYVWSELDYNTFIEADVAAGTAIDLGSTVTFYLSSNTGTTIAQDTTQEAVQPY